MLIIFKASQPRGQASGSHAYGRHEMQGVIIIKCTRHECSVCELIIDAYYKFPETDAAAHNVFASPFGSIHVFITSGSAGDAYSTITEDSQLLSEVTCDGKEGLFAGLEEDGEELRKDETVWDNHRIKRQTSTIWLFRTS